MRLLNPTTNCTWNFSQVQIARKSWHIITESNITCRQTTSFRSSGLNDYLIAYSLLEIHWKNSSGARSHRLLHSFWHTFQMQHLPEAISTKSRSMLNSFKTCTRSDICKKHFSPVENCSIFLTHPKSSNIIFKKHFTRFRLLNSFSTPNPTSAESNSISQRVQVAQFSTHKSFNRCNKQFHNPRLLNSFSNLVASLIFCHQIINRKNHHNPTSSSNSI